MSAPERLNKRQGAFLRAPELVAVFDAIESAGGEVRVNGGAVRNALIGDKVADVDLSTTLLPQQVAAALDRSGLQSVATGIEHGTVTAVSGRRGFEITTLREDIETDGRRAKVRFGTDWSADAQRRDFTLNALYCDRHGRLFDPLGGFDDLKAGRIRFIGNAGQRIAEDYLRILRFFRFIAWYGQGRPDADGLKACAAAKSGLGGLSAERIWHELKRLLGAPDPSRALLWMRTCAVLSEVLPESAKWGIEAVAGLVGAEAELEIAVEPLLRLMAMLPPDRDAIDGLAVRLKLSRAEHRRLVGFAIAPTPAVDWTEAELARRLYADAGNGEPGGGVRDRLLVELARARAYDAAGAKAGKLLASARRALAWKRPQFPLSGTSLMAAGYASGEAMGRELARLEALWIDHGFTWSAEELLGRINPPPASGD